MWSSLLTVRLSHRRQMREVSWRRRHFPKYPSFWFIWSRAYWLRLGGASGGPLFLRPERSSRVDGVFLVSSLCKFRQYKRGISPWSSANGCATTDPDCAVRSLFEGSHLLIKSYVREFLGRNLKEEKARLLESGSTSEAVVQPYGR